MPGKSRRWYAVLDLKGVTFLDEAGEKLLGEMANSGAELVAAGVEKST